MEVDTPGGAGSATAAGGGTSLGHMDTEQKDPKAGQDRTRLIAAGILVVAVVVFAIANSQRVAVDFVITETDSRLFVVILVSAALGAAADRLIQRKRRG